MKKSKRWEYDIIFYPMLGTGGYGDKSDHALLQHLNQLGADGWECFAVVPHDSQLFYFLRRRVANG